MDRTAQAISAMMRESTGSHMCDSGMIYGYNWQRNQREIPKIVPEELYQNDEMILKYDPVWEGVSLYYKTLSFLWQRLTWDTKWNRKFNSFVKEMPEDMSWEDVLLEFMEKEKFKVTWHDLTCGKDSFLQQDFTAWEIETEDGDDLVIIRLHNGCDLRGGYTRPRFFVEVEECKRLFDYDAATICCDKCELFMDVRLGGLDGEYWTDREGIQAESPFKDAKHDAENNILCPKCGAPLKAYD